MKFLGRKFFGVLTLLSLLAFPGVFNLPVAVESLETSLFPVFEAPVQLTAVDPPESVRVPHLSFFCKSIFFSYRTLIVGGCVGRCDFASLGSFEGSLETWTVQVSPLENSVWVGESVFAEYFGYVFAAFKGVDPATYNSDIYFAYFNPRTLQWSDSFPLTDDPAMDRSPAIGVYNGKLYVAWESDKLGTRDVWYSVFDISSWSWSTPAVHPLASDGSKEEGAPEMVEYCGKQFWVWSENGGVHLAYYDGVGWSDEKTVFGYFVGELNPTVAAYGGRTYIVWQNYMANGQYDLWCRF